MTDAVRVGLMTPDSGAVVHEGLCDALLDLAGTGPQTAVELRAGVLEHWGEASPTEVGHALGDLVRAGKLAHVYKLYVRREG